MYKQLIRPVLFLFPAEGVHHFAMKVMKIAGKIPGIPSLLNSLYGVSDKKLERNIAGLVFPNPVGLAAGFDKDAKAFNELAMLGFGFIEIGTVTPKSQAGNPQPRLFRLPKDQALINRMGFNNEGVLAAAKRLKSRHGNKIIIGGNIGKNKITPNEEAVNDYLYCFKELFPVVDYFVVNISSPNTPGLRELQDKEPLIHLLESVQKSNQETGIPKPVFLKIAPDLTEPQVDDIIEITLQTKLAGLIVSNTTISRDGLKTPKEKLDDLGAGGLSGKPVFNKSTLLLKYISNKSNKRFSLIASGGIFSAEDAMQKLNSGADLVQLYTGFIYEGPGLIKAINKALLKI
ncbi:MAG: quinone-dependent dihydroorotate dehydrogenase [Bacteroidetes bacterium]|nr:quinone-dependent dihydroorotate dehydrogenase [Bacteroidota bacterium]